MAVDAQVFQRNIASDESSHDEEESKHALEAVLQAPVLPAVNPNNEELTT